MYFASGGVTAGNPAGLGEEGEQMDIQSLAFSNSSTRCHFILHTGPLTLATFSGFFLSNNNCLINSTRLAAVPGCSAACLMLLCLGLKGFRV